MTVRHGTNRGKSQDFNEMQDVQILDTDCLSIRQPADSRAHGPDPSPCYNSRRLASILKHYRRLGASEVSAPSLFFLVRQDVQDVRSLFRASRTEFFCGEWLDDADLHWTPDMVAPVNPDEIEAFDPPRELNWPDFADSMIIRHSIHHDRPRIWKNIELDLYSRPNESREEFLERCHQQEVRERVSQREELRNVYLHRVLELKTAMMKMVAEESSVDMHRDRRLATVRSLFSDLAQEWDRLPLHDNEPTVRKGPRADRTDRDLHEMVESFRADLRYRFGRIQVEFRPRVGDLEPYDVPVSHSQVEIISRGFLWS